MRARSSWPSGLAKGASTSSTLYGAAWSNRIFIDALPGVVLDLASVAKGGQDLGGESLELGELIVAHEPDAEIADAGRGVPPERGDHHVGGARPPPSPPRHAPALIS